MSKKQIESVEAADIATRLNYKRETAINLCTRAVDELDELLTKLKQGRVINPYVLQSAPILIGVLGSIAELQDLLDGK